MNINSSEIRNAIEVVVSNAQQYLKSTHRITAMAQPATGGSTDTLAMGDCNVVIELGGQISCLVTISFEQRLLSHLMRLEFAGVPVAEGEQALYMSDTAGEISNIITGHSLAYLEDVINAYSEERCSIHMSPPLIIESRDDISENHHYTYTSVPLTTDFGNLTISLIWLDEWFEKISKASKKKETST